MTPHIRRKLTKALQRHRNGAAACTAVITLPARATSDAPQWTPGPGYVEASTAAVYAKPLHDGLAHAVVITDEGGGMVRMLSGIVSASDVTSISGLCDKPWRIRWLAQTPLGDQLLDSTHPAARYRHWIQQLTDTLTQHLENAARTRRVLSGQLTVSATPSGRFQASIDIRTGGRDSRERRHDLHGHAAVLAAVMRPLPHSGRLRFHPPAADHVIDPLTHHAGLQLRSR